MPLPPYKNKNYRFQQTVSQRLRRLRQEDKQTLLKKGWFLLKRLVLTGITVVVLLFVWYALTLPDPAKLAERAVPQSTKIYDRTGQTVLYEFFTDQKRTRVNLSDIPKIVQQATIAVEDKTFYEHKGFNPLRLVKAVFVDVTTLSKAQGGSTITQQLVKNAILTRSKSLTRKIKELVLSYKLEKNFSKDQILEMYLNEIPYGSTVYGIESAAQTFFGKPVKDLTLGEAAILAALPQAPTYYSPHGSHLDALLARQKMVLSLMADQGYITAQQATSAKNEKIVFKAKAEKIIAPHFIFYIRELLADKYGEERIAQGGFKVITTLDADKQKQAEEAIAATAEKNKTYDAGNAALVALDAKTNQILALVGSRDYFDETIDGNVNVAVRPRQPGSSFKPFVYLTALLRGYTPNTVVYDVVTKFPTQIEGTYEPHNYDLKEHGPVTFRQALAGSLNIPAVKVLYLAGISNVLDVAEKIGYTTLKDRSRFGLSLVLGGGEVTLLEHTAAYGVLAREGVRKNIAAILKVEDSDGQILEEWQDNTGDQVVPVEATRNITDMLSDNNARAFIFGVNNHLTLQDRPVAAKTGTTNDYHDAWTIGYTPSLVTGVWVGNSDNKAMKRGADGSIVAAPIWQSFMAKALAGQVVENFNKPLPFAASKPILNGQAYGLVPAKVDRYLNQIIPDYCLNSYPAQYVMDGGYPEARDILHFVNKDDPQGPVPTNPGQDPMYEAWEKPAQEWLAKNFVAVPVTSTLNDCSIRNEENQPTLNITSPLDGSSVSGSVLTIQFSAQARRGITKAKVTIDGQYWGTTTSSVFSQELPGNIGNGFHTITVSVFDDVFNQASRSIVVSVAIPGRQAAISNFSWSGGSALTVPSGATITIPFRLSDNTNLRSIDFFAKGANNQNDRFVGTVANPQTSDQITLNQLLLPDTYQVTPLITLSDGRTSGAPPLTLIITQN